MEYKICIFAGTTEGRRLAEFLFDKSANVTVCVATDYGETLMKENENTKIHTGRLDVDNMRDFFLENNFNIIIDATHPYASTVTNNIKSTCGNTEYLRLNRELSYENTQKCFRCFSTVEESAYHVKKIASNNGKNILLTTGSKELKTFCDITNLSEQIYARVLPLTASLQACSACKIQPSHIIAMQGPFSYELNLAIMKYYNISVLVTKNSGDTGGFFEKIRAANSLDIECVIIGFPPQSDGISYDEMTALLSKRLNTNSK